MDSPVALLDNTPMIRFIFIFAGICLITFAVPDARADLYVYETPDGETLITTERHRSYKLKDVIASGAKKSSSTSAKNTTSSSRSKSSSIPFSQREKAYDDIIREAAARFDVPFGFVKAVIRIESAFQPDVISHAGAQGLMQLMPRTAESVDVTDPFDPRQNIFGGTKFLRILIDRYDGDINLVLAAYNAGDVAVKRHDGIPYAQTRQYVASVYHWYHIYSEDETSQ